MTPAVSGSGDTISPSSASPADHRDGDDVERMIRAIERREAGPIQPNGVYFDSEQSWRRRYRTDVRELPRWILPGFGEQEPDCGRPFLLACENGHVHETTRTPGSSTCPFCAPVWARDRAIDAVARLESYKRYAWSSGTYDRMHLHHVVVSPGSITVEAGSAKDAFEKVWETIKTVLDELGAIAGFGAYHPWSGDHDEDSLEDDRGAWKDRLFEERDWQGDVLEELEFRPHFHTVVLSPYIHGGEVTKRLEEETGWIVERIADEETGKSIDGLHDLARVVAYTLSHTGLYDRADGSTRSATRWFGINDAEFREPAPHIQEAADKAVRDVAPEVLGLPQRDQHCHTDLSDDGGLDLSLELGNGPTSGGSGIRNASSGSSGPTAGELPTAHDGDFPLQGDGLQESSASWSTPIPSEGRLEALRKASPAELIAAHSEITEENVWEIKNSLETTTPDEDVCGQPLRPAHQVIERLDQDREKRREAESLEELREAATDLLEDASRDLDGLEAALDEFRGIDLEDVDELLDVAGDLLEVLGEYDELGDLRDDLLALLKRPTVLGSLSELQAEMARRVEEAIEDLEAVPSHLRPIAYHIDEAGPWIQWDGPGTG